MQRYHSVSCPSTINNSSFGGSSARDTLRPDPSSLPANLKNSRRPTSLAPYRLKCEKEPLNSRLGPPDFHPQTPNCLEETLTAEYVQSGYRETIEGIEEAKEITLFQTTVFNKPVVLKCREAIRKCLRAINESRAQKRKAGQVYGVPLSGLLLTKSGVFPEQKPCSEDFKKKWIEGLSQPHKRLRSLADHVPHGYRRKFLIEVLIKNNVPLLRATWFVKVIYLNQLRPSSSGAPDKTQLSRTEVWTKDVIEYLQILLDEFISRNSSHSSLQSRDRSPQVPYAGSMHQRTDMLLVAPDEEEPSLHFKWWYVVRLMHWHHAEGLLLPSTIIEWVLSQLQEKCLLEILQLLLPIIYGFLESVVLSQTYVRSLVGIAVHFIREPSPGGSDLVDNSRRAYATSALVEMLRYLILAVPETFVALDCFPLPSSVVSYAVSDSPFSSKVSEEARKMKDNSEVGFIFRSKGLDAQYQSLSFDKAVSSIQKCADNLAKAASPARPVHCMAKAVQTLDRTLSSGDIRPAYNLLFGNSSDGVVDAIWIEEVTPCLRSSMKWLGSTSLSFISSVFFLCEWATCDYRDSRSSLLRDLKITGRKDFSQVYIASRLLKLKIRDLQSQRRRKSESFLGTTFAKFVNENNILGKVAGGDGFGNKINTKVSSAKNTNSIDLFESPGPLHDIIVCWIDQHEVFNGEGLKRLQLLLVELLRFGIFYPQAYVRQLIISGIMDTSVSNLDRRKRHHRILKYLPGCFIYEVLKETGIIEESQFLDTIGIYSNERCLLLRGVLSECSQDSIKSNVSVHKQKYRSHSGKDISFLSSIDPLKVRQPGSEVSTLMKTNSQIEELKATISLLLQLPSCNASSESGLDESQGSVKKSTDSTVSKMDLSEGTPGCEDCRRAKRQKLSDDKSSSVQGQSPVSDDEDNWWVRKGSKPPDAAKVDTPPKLSKQVSKMRQKTVRKTQSLAQIAASHGLNSSGRDNAARIEGSQGASSSHVCNNKTSCTHHRNGIEGEAIKASDGSKLTHGVDIISIGKALKQLRFAEMRTLTVWLVATVKQLVEETEKSTAKVNHFSKSSVSVDDKSSLRWKLGDDELSTMLYLMDVCNELVSAVKFLLWLLPKVVGNPTSTMQSGRSIMMIPRNMENHACEVGEAFLISCLRRYENILLAADLIPEVLVAAMQRVEVLLSSSGKVSGSVSLIYCRQLLKKYGNVPSVSEWEKTYKATCDKRLLSELEAARSVDGEFVFPLGVPAGVEDLDDFYRQKISGNRMTRVGISMRDVVQRHINDAFPFAKERKLFGPGAPKGAGLELTDDGYQIAQQIIMGLMDCIRQTGGAAQEGDPSLVSSAVSAIVNSIGSTMAKILDFIIGNNQSNASSASGSLGSARRLLRIHINCLSLLKEALGERQNRVFEIALAIEASSAVAAAFAPGKGARSQFQLSSEAHDSSGNNSNENSNSSAKAVIGRVSKSIAAISALVIGAIIHSVTNLERMVAVFRLKEGLDLIQFLRSTKSNSNGNARSVGSYQMESTVEVYVHWFRVLVGNCRTVADGLIVELLGEPSIVALSRMQQHLPLSLVFPPAYTIFAFVIWKPLIAGTNLATGEDFQQLFQSLIIAITDVIKHLPFRYICLRDCQGLYDFVAADASDAEFAAILDLKGFDSHFKTRAFVPLRGRLFLNAIIDCKMPESKFAQEDGSWVFGHGGRKAQPADGETKLMEKLINVLDTLQPAKFHWQWVELRLLLNEQALVEKLENHDVSLADAIRSTSPGTEKGSASENENKIIEVILTRLLVRPDAAPLFSELVHLFGRSLEDSMLLLVKWFLGGPDVLFGRKTIRQRLMIIAESNGLPTKAQFWKPWGWYKSSRDPILKGGDTGKLENSLEEGEVVEEGIDTKRSVKGSAPTADADGSVVAQQHVTERALIELVMPCIDQCSDDSRNTFTNDLIKQLNNIEQQINAVTRGASKHAGTSSPGLDGPVTKGSSRKGIRGGSPGLARRTAGAAGAADSALLSPAALRASMFLRLKLLLRLLPYMYMDGEPSGRSMRQVLASVILRLLGSRIVHEDADISAVSTQSSRSKTEVLSPFDASSVDSLGESLFDQLLLVLHGLLSSCQPSWLKSKHGSRSANESSKDNSGIDCEVVEALQNDLDRMQLPGTIRWRIQVAMPILLPSVRCCLSFQPPSVPAASVALLQPSMVVSGILPGSQSQRNSVPSARAGANAQGKSKPLPQGQDNDIEVDRWTLLEDGTGSATSSSNTSAIGSGDHANLRAASWHKGAVRVRRMDLSYIGAVDDDS